MFNKGTTLVELIIVVALISILAVFSFFTLLQRKGQNDFDNAGQSMAAMLREARSRSVSQSSSTSWGVHFENSTTTTPFYALFPGSYATATIIGYYRLPTTVGYVTSSLASGASKEITFSQITGLASQSTSIAIYSLSNSANSSTINVASSGAVSY